MIERESTMCHEKGSSDLEELVVQDEKYQEDEADNDAYGNQFLLFGPAAQKDGEDRLSG